MVNRAIKLLRQAVGNTFRLPRPECLPHRAAHRLLRDLDEFPVLLMMDLAMPADPLLARDR